ncbi:hypothetical protein SUGI_1226490 [Cryptomeria japonica]|uniref:Uncharacterized protein n=1 Tax=Cryptomeria japonica TaxID=3369 RepID=A0AAD3NP05_CRYJA|nr:hypothetical protein SUGI_1226490 [Cryptomeria japonica]
MTGLWLVFPIPDICTFRHTMLYASDCYASGPGSIGLSICTSIRTCIWIPISNLRIFYEIFFQRSPYICCPGHPEVREQIHRRLMAASEETHYLESTNPHPLVPPGRPGLASLLEEVGGPESRPNSPPGTSNSGIMILWGQL